MLPNQPSEKDYQYMYGAVGEIRPDTTIRSCNCRKYARMIAEKDATIASLQKELAENTEYQDSLHEKIATLEAELQNVQKENKELVELVREAMTFPKTCESRLDNWMFRAEKYTKV